jgi:hypothetical protein
VAENRESAANRWPAETTTAGYCPEPSSATSAPLRSTRACAPLTEIALRPGAARTITPSSCRWPVTTKEVSMITGAASEGPWIRTSEPMEKPFGKL